VKRAFVIGHPVTHSRSPLIHRHWLASYGIEGSYEPFDVALDELAGFLERIRSGEFIGGNVTLPHKEAAYALVDLHDTETSYLGAYNTLGAVESDGRRQIHGSNTDLYGFLANLDQEMPGWDHGTGNAIVLGAGGAARAVVAALSLRVAGTVNVLNRSLARADELVATLPGHLAARPLEEFPVLAPDCRLLVNTTTIGMHGTRFDALDLRLLPRTALVTDIVYTPPETPLLAEARSQGLRTVDGLGMLLHQAVPGFAAWFGVRPDVTGELRDKIAATL
jgi:shikimate dehydrogenase